MQVKLRVYHKNESKTRLVTVDGVYRYYVRRGWGNTDFLVFDADELPDSSEIPDLYESALHSEIIETPGWRPRISLIYGGGKNIVLITKEDDDRFRKANPNIEVMLETTETKINKPYSDRKP